jgi:cell division inhibitor SepF
MATAMKRLGVYLGFVDDDLDYDGYDQGSGESITGHSDASAPAGRSSSPTGVATVPRTADVRSSSRQVSGSNASTSSEPVQAPVDPYSIHTLHPRSYNEARRIGEEFRAGSPVIMNLTEMDDTDAKRIVDFAAGLVFATYGSMERITKKVFLLSPANVDLRDAPAVRQARDGFFNQS